MLPAALAPKIKRVRSVLEMARHVLAAVMVRDTWKGIAPCDVLLVRHDGDSGYTYLGRAYAPLSDSFGDLCRERGLAVAALATSYSRLSGDRAYNHPTSYNRAWLVSAVFGRAIRLIRGRRTAQAWTSRRRERLWSGILRRAAPRCVVGIQPNEYLCRVAKTEGIPVYDLQHGAIYDDHPWYGAEYRVNTPAVDLPDGFLCWDDASAKALRRWAPARGMTVLVVGNPWFDRFRLGRSHDALVAEARVLRPKTHSNRPRVLVSLQWGLEKEYNDPDFNGVMASALEAAILQTADSYEWLLRLHPIQMRGPDRARVVAHLERTFGHVGSVRWRSSTEAPLPVVLGQVDAHITDSSTVVVEAAWMGIQSGLLSTHIRPHGKWSSLFSEERTRGIASVVLQEVEAIKSWTRAGRVRTASNAGRRPFR